MADAGWPESYIRAMESHGWGLCVDVEPKSDMEKTLYAIDELTGFIGACALGAAFPQHPRHGDKVGQEKMEVRGVRRRRQPRGDREGAAMLGLELDVLIGETILAMRPVAADIGLAG